MPGTYTEPTLVPRLPVEGLGIEDVDGLAAALAAKAATAHSHTYADVLAAAGFIGVVNVNSNITIGAAHYGKLLIVTGVRTFTMPAVSNGARFGIYCNNGASVIFDGSLPILDARGSAKTTTDSTENYLIVEAIGSFFVGSRLGGMLMTLNDVLTKLGVVSYADLAAANAALPGGKIYYDIELEKLNLTSVWTP